jgi:hypothetical protein
MVPSLNLGSDSLGLGALFQGFTNASGTADCGSKPTCISFGKNSNCAKKTQAYNECLARSVTAKTITNPETSNNKTLIGIVILVVVVVLIIILLKK